jgi:hypothetical protein
VDGQTKTTSALTLAGELIPEVGSILVSLSSAIELNNEREIKLKLQKINQLIRDDQKNLIAKYIAAKLTIKRRSYIANLSMTDIKASVNNFERLKLLFDD